ncbi:hypothetical protein ACP4OV_025166 [Aristida adscensionis]
MPIEIRSRPTTSSTGATMAGEDRLSNLGDNLLRRILYFAPAKEGAATSALSRRWRPLWRSSGAVNLAVRIHDDGGHCGDREAEEAFFSRRDAFVRAAKAALAAAGHVTRLTLHVEADHGYHLLSRFLTRGMDWRVDHDVAGDLVAQEEGDSW